MKSGLSSVKVQISAEQAGLDQTPGKGKQAEKIVFEDGVYTVYTGIDMTTYFLYFED